MKKLLYFLLLLAFALPAEAQLWTGILPTNRALDWTQVGLIPVGGIPSGSWTQCGGTIAAYTGTAATINTAINACGTNQFVLLGPGAFSLSTPITIKGRNRLVLRGSGANSTFVTFTGSTSTCLNGLNSCLIDIESTDTTYPTKPGLVTYDWTAGFSKGSTSITLSSGSNIVAGVTSIILDQCDDGYTGAVCAGTSTDNGGFYNCATKYSNSSGVVGCAPNGPSALARLWRNQAEIVEAVSCSPSCGNAGATTVTITPPIMNPNWAIGQTPKAWLVQPNQYVGIENMSIDAGTLTPAEIIGFGSMSYSWVTGVRIANGWQSGIMGYISNHMEFTSNYIFNTGRDLAFSDPYQFRYNGANYLIQNNIGQRTRVFALAEGAAPGSVIAYNYSVNQYYPGDFMYGGYEPHSDGNNYLLYEGNVGVSLINENLHGTQSFNTSFRNFFTGWESCGDHAGICGPASLYGGSYPAGTYGFKDSSIYAMKFDAFGRYPNIVANVLGTPGIHTAYQSASGYPFIYQMGGGSGISPTDPIVASTSMRWGNYDVYTATIGSTTGKRFCGSAANTDWVTNCASTSEIPTGIAGFPVSLPTVGDVTAGQSAFPASFYLSVAPSFFTGSGLPWPGIGPDITGGNIGICAGTKNTAGQFAKLPATANAKCVGTSLTTPAWGAHANTNPATNCFQNVMGGNPNGTDALLAFDPNACYNSASVPIVSLTWSGGAFPMAFGNHVVGVASGALTATLTNTGSATLTYTGISVTGTNSADFVATAGSCNLAGSTLAAGASCTVNVVFTPSVCGGGYPCAKTANLQVLSNASSSPDLGVMTGTSTAAPVGTGTPSNPTLTGMLWNFDKYAFYRCTPYPCATACYSCSLPFGVKRPVITFK